MHIKSHNKIQNRASKFVNFNVRDFDFSLSPVLLPQVRPFVTGSDKSGGDNVDSDAASRSLLILRT
jgi:hypothetical protein